MIKKFICIQCPRGCHLEVDTETLEVKGNSCPRGEAYGKAEVSHPLRTITSTVKIVGGDIPRCSVRTNKPIPKEKMFDVMKELNKVELMAPVNVGDVVIGNVLGLGADIIVTKKIDKVP